MRVQAIWRYPIKAMLGELLDAVMVSAGGLEGDRRWVVADAETGERVASKRGASDARLSRCRARLVGDQPEVVLPDGHGVARGAVDVGHALSEMLERDVELVSSHGAGRGYGDTGAHHDFAPVHALSTRSLRAMARRFPDSDWSPARFRPNLLLTEADASVAIGDHELLGSSLHRASHALHLDVGLPTPRCVVVTRAHDAAPPDASVLRHVAATNRWDLGPFGRPACFGTYAEVVGTGTLRSGDALEFRPARQTAAASVAEVVRRLEHEP